METTERILIIKHGALGDIVQATGPIAAIRSHHPDAGITLLTTPPFAALFEACPWIDDVITDPRPKWWQAKQWWPLLRLLRQKFDRIYDLQTSSRTDSYFRLVPRRTEWSGTARGASHRYASAERAQLHTVERQQRQLAVAGIPDVPAPSLDWLDADISDFQLPADVALLVPGGSAHRPTKRWPHYAALSQWLLQKGLTPILLGAAAEQDLLNDIVKQAPGSISLCNRTSFAQLAALARRARVAVGNDTGPMHVAAAAGCPSLVLFSQESNPALCAPRGRKVEILRVPNLADLTPKSVTDYLSAEFLP